MKKFISVFLAALLALFCLSVPLSAFAADDQIKFAVAADLHVEAPKDTLKIYNPESELYFHASGSGNLYDEAMAITRSCLKDAKNQGAEFVIIPGDMTRSGTETEHKYVAGELEKFEKESGISVYVVPGNHDYFDSTPVDIKEYYKELGYGEALTVDSITASYTADLNKNYRLLAVDSNDPGDDGDGVDDRLFDWIDTQVKQADADGKQIIYMMHHSVLEHLTLGKLLMKDFIMRNSDDVAERFCEWGIQYVFTGHEHGNDIARYEGKNGNVLYDVLTTSLSSYPLEYRMLSYGSQGVSIKMRKIDECDFDSLTGGYNEKQLALMKSDYNAYAYGYFRYAVEKKILKYTSPDFIKGKIKIQDGIIADEIDAVMSLVGNTLKMPLYDSGNGGMSIEKLVNMKGISLPESDYNSLVDLVTALAALHYYGDENLPSSQSPESEIFVKGLNAGLEYILSNVGKESVKALFGITDEILGTEGEESQALYRWFITAAQGGEKTYEAAGAVLYPILDCFTFDKAPADRDAELPAPGEKAASSDAFAKFLKTFLETLFKVLNYVLNIVMKVM